MVRNADQRQSPLPKDPDQVDFSWLTTFFRRLGGRVLPPSEAPTPTAESPPSVADGASPPPEGGEPSRLAARFRRQQRADDGHRRQVAMTVVPLIVVAVIGLLALNDHFGGIEWGDDFALYVRQAKALTVGNIDEVIRQNRFAVDNSGWHTFSPYSYPWGWPLLMAPAYALFGLNYGVLKFLEVVAFCVFLLAFFAVVRRRTPLPAAVIITLVIGLSPAFVGFTDTVLSDLPYLCFVGLSLWWMDRCREKGLLDGDRRPLVILGLLLAFTFNIRREGMSLVVALAGLHLAVLVARAVKARSPKALADLDWKRVATPYVTFALSAVAFQLLLPTDLFPNLPGAGVENASRHITYYRDALAEQVGLKDPGTAAQLFHSHPAAEKAITFLLVFAAAGVVARLLHRFELDVTLAVYLCTTTLIMLVSPFQEPRYLFTITPLIVYFAYQALPTIARLSTPRERRPPGIAAWVPALALAGLVVANAGDLAHALDYHRHNHYVVNGPEQPAAKEMFAKVKELTRGDDVILFFRARAMGLYADRVAIQGSDLGLLLPRSDWYAMEKGSTYSQTPLTDAEGAARGLTKAWENANWVIWRVPPRRQ